MPSRTLGGRYTVQDKIGTGGMAMVYRGIDDVLGRTVAIKTMLPQYANDQSFAARFKQEAQAAAALQSPYIVSVYDWGKDDDTYYIIMEYLRGTDLKSGIRKHGALDCRKVAQIGCEIAQALEVAHRHDIIHRDIKPQNIMVQPDGNIKVMDFGIARAKNSHLTADNSVLGTAHYVSPEQTQGKELGPTTDIYSLGIVMYEAATGRVPFDGDDAISVALKQVNETPLPPSQINPNVDPALESIILKCMQKRPEDRFQTANELYRVLRDYLSGRSQAVLEQTSVVAPSVTERRGRVSGNTGTGRTNEMQGYNTDQTDRFNSKSAAAQEVERRHRRNVIMGIVASLIVVGLVAVGAFLLLNRTSTRSVPNLVGLTKDEAIKQIEQSDYFTLGSITQEYSDKVAEGMVSDQDPDPNSSAPEGTKINLVVSKGEEPAKTVTVPDLKNMTVSEAEAELAKVGLKGKEGESVYSDDVENGRVAAQKPGKGSTAKAGSTVTYQLSKGPETVEVPNVVGYAQDDAVATLEAAGFTVIVNSAESDTYSAGLVSYQSVTGSAPQGTEIVITVYTGTSKVTVPSVAGMSQSEALATLGAYGFATSVQEVTSETVPAGYVVWQSTTGQADRGATVVVGVPTGPATPVTPDPEPEPTPTPDPSGEDTPSDPSTPSESGDSSESGESTT